MSWLYFVGLSRHSAEIANAAEYVFGSGVNCTKYAIPFRTASFVRVWRSPARCGSACSSANTGSAVVPAGYRSGKGDSIAKLPSACWTFSASSTSCEILF